MRKILVMSIVVILVILLCNVGQAIAQDQSKDFVNSASLNQEEYRKWMQDLMTGKIDKPPGAKDYEPPENPELLARPTPPVEQDRLIIYQDENLISPMSPGIAAGFQCFIGGEPRPGCGRVCAGTSTVTRLRSNGAEWHVMHQWPTSGENCIVITYFPQEEPYSGVFGIFISAFSKPYQDYVRFPASHSFSMGIVPQHPLGSTAYTKINFWITDLTTGSYWSKTYTLSTTQYIKDVDAALEHNDTVPPNALWKTFTDFFTYDKNLQLVNLSASFQWKQWPSPTMYNRHDEFFYPPSYYVYGNLHQTKVPK